jgi:hypothetical protein
LLCSSVSLYRKNAAKTLSLLNVSNVTSVLCSVSMVITVTLLNYKKASNISGSISLLPIAVPENFFKVCVFWVYLVSCCMLWYVVKCKLHNGSHFNISDTGFLASLVRWEWSWSSCMKSSCWHLLWGQGKGSLLDSYTMCKMVKKFLLLECCESETVCRCFQLLCLLQISILRWCTLPFALSCLTCLCFEFHLPVTFNLVYILLFYLTLILLY